MNIKLHANATTTPRTRAYIQASRASNTSLARELGISSRTVARWKRPDHVRDAPHLPHRHTSRPSTSLHTGALAAPPPVPPPPPPLLAPAPRRRHPPPHPSPAANQAGRHPPRPATAGTI